MVKAHNRQTILPLFASIGPLSFECTFFFCSHYNSIWQSLFFIRFSHNLLFP